MAVKYYTELLNYIDIPVLSIHVSEMIDLISVFDFAFFSRENKNKQNEHIHFLNFAMLKREFYCVRM